MDLLSIQPHTAELVLKSPADRTKDAGLTLQILPATSEAAVDMRKKHQAERDELVKRGADKVPDDVAERQGVETYAARVSSWKWEKGLTLGDEANPDCTLENVVKLLSSSDWVLSDLLRFVARGENFYANFKDGS